jgi:uncharacterized protein (DUF1330 family)|tara:strand:+ start:1225 stop:1509 length:285 start_codon:yes stop_codon:yes gene_type:complete
MTAYWIAHVDVTDPDTYAKYAKLATAPIEAHGGKFLARGSRTVWLEGNVRARNVIVEFPSFEDAERCYHSDEYGEALKFSKIASIRDVCIIEGN